MNVFEQLSLERLLAKLTEKGLALLCLFISFFLVKQFLHYLARKTIFRSLKLATQDDGRRDTLLSLSYNIMDYALYFLLTYWIFVILGVPVSSLLAGAGLTGLAIGLGAQGFLTDLINGMFILIERQYDVGETIKVATVSGMVTKVGIRTTQLKDADGTIHFIPNRQITVVSNLSRDQRRVRIELPLTQTVNLNQLEQAIQSVNQEPNILNLSGLVQAPTIRGLTTDEAGNLVYRIDCWVENGRQDAIYYQLFQRYYQALQDLKKPS